MSRVKQPTTTQPFADLWRTYCYATTDTVKTLTDEQLQAAREDFESLTTTNCEWTHYGARDQSLDAIKIEQRGRANAIKYALIDGHRAAIKALDAEIHAR